MLLFEAFKFSVSIAIFCTVLIIIFDFLKFNSKKETKVSRLRNTSHRRGIR